MNDKEIKDKARELLKPFCRVCPSCNGVACRGEVPGMGGKGSGVSFMKNYDDLSAIGLKMETLHGIDKVDTSYEIFGQKMDIPVFAAPVSGAVLNMGGKLTEKEYITAVVNGCIDGNIIPMVGDSALPTFLTDNLDALKNTTKPGIVFIKPWDNEDIKNKMELAYKSNVCAIGVDIDAAGLSTLKMHGKSVSPKTMEQLKDLVKSSKLPFIAKGVLTVKDAQVCYEAGVDAIVVSNHGGRVLDYAISSVEALPEIVEKFKGKMKIFADGGVRSGVDVFKLLALGADAVLIGRPFVTYSFGGGREGVKFYVDKLKSELSSTMMLTGTKDISSINTDMISVKNLNIK